MSRIARATGYPDTDQAPVRLRFRPFYEIGEAYPYFMYFDRRALPRRLW